MSTQPPVPSVESLFLRWREQDDPEAFAELLARTEDELFGVARRQVRDDAAAWDLVQETWLTVLREAHRFDATQRLMPWVVGIVQIGARRSRRNDARVPDPARLDAPPTRAADVEVPAAEVQSIVVRALEKLPSLYREVVTLHLLEDLSHAEIAARTGREPGTVRVQVFRGLAQLRKHVPASLSLGVALAVLAPRSEAARLGTLLDGAARGSSSAPTGARESATAGAATATSAVSTGWIIAAAAAALLAGGAWLAFDAARDAQPIGQATTTSPSSAPVGVERTPTSADVRTSSRAVAATPATVVLPATGVRIVGHVAGLAALQPASPTVTVRANRRAPIEVAVDATERFEIDVGAWYATPGDVPREFIVEYDHPNALPASRPVLLDAAALAAAHAAAQPGSSAREAIEVSFALRPPAARAHGVAIWSAGVPSAARTERVAGLYELDAAGQPAADPVEGVVVQPDGAFWLRAARTGSHALVLAARDGALRPTTIALELEPGEDEDVGRVELAPGARIAGTVARPARPQAGSALAVHCRYAGSRRVLSLLGSPLAFDPSRRAFESTGGIVLADEGGAFALAGLAPHADYVLRSTWRERDTGKMSGDVDDDTITVRSGTANVVMRAPDASTVVDVRAGGAPAAGAYVTFGPEGGSSYGFRTDEFGRARLQGDVPGTMRIALEGYERFEGPYSGAPETRIEVDLVPLRDAGSVVLVAPGVDLNDAVCVLVRASALDANGLAALRRGEPIGPGDGERATLDAGGRIVTRVPTGRWWLQLKSRSPASDGLLAHARPFVAEIEVVSDTTTRVDVELELAGRVRLAPVASRDGAGNGAADGAREVKLELVGPDGATLQLELSCLVLRGDGRQGRVRRLDSLPCEATGTSSLLEPGPYVLRARLGAEVWTRSFTVERGRTTLVELDPAAR